MASEAAWPSHATGYPSELAVSIGGELGESRPAAMRLIHRIVDRRGEPFVRELVERTHQIEDAGGIYLESVGRRRTVGGVFFFLAKQSMGQEWDEISPPLDWKKRKELKKRGRAQAQPQATVVPASTSIATTSRSTPVPTSAALSMEEAVDAARAAATQRGEAKTVKATLVGRPSKIEKRAGCVVTVMENHRAPTLPKGLPPPPTSATRFTVFIASKQWSKVETALAADPEDKAVIDGWASFVPELGGMGLFATNVTTVALQAAKKQQALGAPSAPR